jgi:transposase-like protein
MNTLAFAGRNSELDRAPRGRLTPEQRKALLREHIEDGKSSGLLARKYGVHQSYPRFLAYCARHGRPSRARAA